MNCCELYYIFAFSTDLPVKIGESILQILDMIKLVHVYRVFDGVVVLKALIGNVGRLTVTRSVAFEQVYEKFEFPAHNYAIFK